MKKEKIKPKKLFIIVHIIVFLLLLYPLIKQLYNIFYPIFFVFYAISFIWSLKLLKDENKLTISKVLGFIILYGVGYYNVFKVFLHK